MGRKKLYEGVPCSCCGNEQAEIKGLCKKCYGCLYYASKNPTAYHAGRRGPERSETTLKAMKFLGDGMKQSEIARILGVSRQRISIIAKSGGVTND